MRVGLLTTWRTQCGIAEYSSHLARGLQHAGADVVVLASKNDEAAGRHLPAEPGFDHSESILQVPIFDVQAWRSDARHDLDVEKVLALNLDVLHVQYEAILYHREKLQRLLDRFEGVKVITYHDNCIPPDMPGPFDVAFRHRADTGPAGTVIPMGVENMPPVVKTFGLGRSRADMICSICDRHGWKFEQSFGDQRWLGQAELRAWLREADAIVLWYPEVDSAGSSLAARTALATRRPLIVNDVTWFRDLLCDWPGINGGRDFGVERVASLGHLESALDRLFDRSHLTTWDEVARVHLDAYAR